MPPPPPPSAPNGHGIKQNAAFPSTPRPIHSTSTSGRPVTSSSSPAMTSSSKVRAFLTVVVVVVVVFQPDVVESRRWMSPCGGGSTSVASAGSRRDVIWTQLPAPQEVRHSFRRLSEKSAGLKRKVRDLKQQYVTHRFRDAQLAEDLERLRIRLDGMPVLEEATAGSIATIDEAQTIHQAFERLAKVSVFLDQARIGETLSHAEHVSFETAFGQLEDHVEYGLYWLLCELRRLILLSGRTVDPGIVREILGIRVVDVDSNSLRHARDYLVLHGLEGVLDQMSVDFASLHLRR